MKRQKRRKIFLLPLFVGFLFGHEAFTQKITGYPLGDEKEFKTIFEILFNADGSFFLVSASFHLYLKQALLHG